MNLKIIGVNLNAMEKKWKNKTSICLICVRFQISRESVDREKEKQRKTKNNGIRIMERTSLKRSHSVYLTVYYQTIKTLPNFLFLQSKPRARRCHCGSW